MKKKPTKKEKPSKSTKEEESKPKSTDKKEEKVDHSEKKSKSKSTDKKPTKEVKKEVSKKPTTKEVKKEEKDDDGFPIDDSSLSKNDKLVFQLHKALKEHKNKEEIDKIENEIVDVYEEIITSDLFYKLPISKILNITSKVNFCDLNDEFESIKCLIKKTGEKYPKKSGLLLHAIKCEGCKFNMDQFTEIFSSFSNSPLCKLFVDYQKVQNSLPTLDHKWEIEQRDKTIQELKQEKKIAQQTNDAIPLDFEPNLIDAIKQGKYQSVKYIFEYENGDVDAILDDEFNTPLLTAAEANETQIFEYLMGKEANPTVVNTKGYSALHYAVLKQNTKMIELLLQNEKVDVNLSAAGIYPIHLAAQKHGKVAANIASMLYQSGADPEALTDDGQSPLHLATKKECIEVIEELVENMDVDINVQDPKGIAPIHIAAQIDNLPLFEYLCEKGANIDLQTNEGLTPLHYAVKKGNDFIIYSLTEVFKCNVNIQDENGQTPLHYAAIFDSEPMLYNFQDEPDKDHKWDREDVAGCLVKNGTLLDIKDKKGKIPRDYATVPDVQAIIDIE